MLPNPLFITPTSTVLEDRYGNLLGALIADDGQWRFPLNSHVPDKFKKAIIQFEDRRFFHHPGIDPLAMGRAMIQNFRSGKIRSGGSTLPMQVIRLSRKGKPRTFLQKLIEIVLAVRLEISYSKNEILSLYASQAPFGGNVVGLDASAWRYFGRAPDQLSWGETAMLAVLPNSPALVHPGKNRIRLKEKRDRLIDRLLETGDIDSMECKLSKAEPLPEKPLPLPQIAPHLLARAYSENFKNKKSGSTLIRSTLDKNLQLQVNNIVFRHHEVLRGNGINNAAVIVADVVTGEVLSYVGNVYNPGKPDFESYVDIITSPRSTGSILKPFLFAAMLSDGGLLPNTLVPDIPTQIAGFSPQNFNRDYDGAVPARRALERSLNVPAVRMLRNYGVEKFYFLLKKIGMSTLTQPAEHYGLSIILGGAEGTLWDIAGIYADMARTLNHFSSNSGRYDRGDFRPLQHVLQEDKKKKENNLSKLDATGCLSASSIWCTFNAMEEVSRPDEERNWQEFSSSQRIAWKTGTSFGFRDGWAIGCTAKNIVSVWVGNADGEGRPELTGIGTAAPIMFEVFKLLKTTKWFEQPLDEMERIPVCGKSGHRALEICEQKDSMWIPSAGLKTPPCPYHQIIHLDNSEKFRVNSDCESTSRMVHRSRFVLPPAQEWFYKSKNSNYAALPPFKKGCSPSGKSSVMEFIYPKKSTQIYVPVELDGKTGKVVFEIAHRNANTLIYWHLDEEYLGFSKEIHQFALSPAPGKHLLTLVDEQGERVELEFEILKK